MSPQSERSTGPSTPKTPKLGEFPAWWEANKDRFHNKKIAMFCTGGQSVARKSTNYLIGQGRGRCFHLKAGSSNTLKKSRKSKAAGRGDSLFEYRGQSVGHAAERRPAFMLCHAAAARSCRGHNQSGGTRQAFSCPHCVDQTSDADKARSVNANAR